MRAGIAIASHNEGELLWKTVRSCLETTGDLDFEVDLTVVDDASTDDTIERLRERYPKVKTFVNPARMGVSATKDRAGRLVEGDVILFLDAHCKPEPGAIERLIIDVEETGGEAIVTPKVAALDPDTWECDPSKIGYGFQTELSAFDCSWIDRDLLKVIEHPGGKSYLRQPSMIGCSLAIHRGLYEKLWGFDPHMKSYGSEDIDFGFKSWLMGHPIYLDTEALIGHRFRDKFYNYEVPNPHQLLNQFRMARKNFTDANWELWLKRNKPLHEQPVWEAALNLLDETRETLERERNYLMKERKHDEFWYAREFGLTDSLLAVELDLTIPRLEFSPTIVPRPPKSPTPPPNDNG